MGPVSFTTKHLDLFRPSKLHFSVKSLLPTPASIFLNSRWEHREFDQVIFFISEQESVFH